MILRDAAEPDIDGIIAIDPVAATDETQRQRIREWVKSGCAIVVQIEERVVAYAVLEHTFFSCGFISMLIVHESYWRQGIATALVDRIEETCNTAKIFTSTNESNIAMRAFLTNKSYVTSGILHNLDVGDPELFFFKNISPGS